MRGRDPERAASLLASAARYRDDLTEREKLMLRIYEERWGKRDLKVLECLYDEYLRRFPKDPEGFEMRAGVPRERGPHARGHRGVRAPHRREPELRDRLQHARVLLGEEGRERRRARTTSSATASSRPNDANPLDSLGELYAFTGRYDEAEENLRKAIAIKEDFYAPWGHLGTVEVGRGNPLKAAEYFRKGSDNAPNNYARYDFRFLAAMCLVDAGRPDEAVKEFGRRPRPRSPRWRPARKPRS